MGILANLAVSALSGAAAAGAVLMAGTVSLQSLTPGTPDIGHSNVSGYSLAGRFGANTSPTLARVQVNETGSLQGVRSITGSGVAVYGQSTATSGLGAGGYFTTDSVGGRGIVGDAMSTSGNTVGGLFYNRSNGGVGVWGKCVSTSGTSVGVLGESPSPGGVGIKAVNSAGGAGGVALLATSGLVSSDSGTVESNNTDTVGPGHALYAAGGSLSGEVLVATTNQASPTNVWALFGNAKGTTARGVYGYAQSATGTNYGVAGGTASATGYGVYSFGNMGATGTKSLVIDNPLDPANSILKQYCAEGEEPLMIYSGRIVLDGAGSGHGQLPAYFDAIARSPRYSLSAIGKSMPGLYVAQEAVSGRFKVSGGVAGGKVDWTVYASRNDPWVRANGAPVIVPKSGADKGKFLNPQFYGQPASKEMGLHEDERQRRLTEERSHRP